MFQSLWSQCEAVWLKQDNWKTKISPQAVKQSHRCSYIVYANKTLWVISWFAPTVHGYRSEERRMKEDQASSRKSAFLLVTFHCDCHSNTKCLKQIKRFVISQLIRFLNIYTVIMKHFNSFTREARAALCWAWKGSGDDPWPHCQSLWRHSVVKKIQRFKHAWELIRT